MNQLHQSLLMKTKSKTIFLFSVVRFLKCNIQRVWTTSASRNGNWRSAWDWFTSRCTYHSSRESRALVSSLGNLLPRLSKMCIYDYGEIKWKKLFGERRNSHETRPKWNLYLTSNLHPRFLGGCLLLDILKIDKFGRWVVLTLICSVSEPQEVLHVPVAWRKSHRL